MEVRGAGAGRQPRGTPNFYAVEGQWGRGIPQRLPLYGSGGQGGGGGGGRLTEGGMGAPGFLSQMGTRDPRLQPT